MMRLVCPNCEAKYEVPEDAVPETGRDVQCANCGHAWFQMRPRAAAVDPVPVPAPVAPPAPAPAPEMVVEAAVVTETVAEAAPKLETVPQPVAEASPVLESPVLDADVEPALAPDPEPVFKPASEPEPEVVVEAVAEPLAEAEPALDTVEAAEDADSAAPNVPAAAVGAAAYAVNDSVLAILREEAEREAKARQSEAGRALETQTDLGLDQAMPVATKVPEVAGEDPALVARRTRLPDVEEINSTLRPSEVGNEDMSLDAMPVTAESRSSFRSGFLVVMTLAIIGSGIYASADAIVEAVPALAGPLKGYVGFVDSLRLQLDGLMQSATVAINND